ncbi:hypothetical protein EVAR_84422_1 [Eumeta japonica]|uniref:Uncharacterized protein n=1 Tax=Eumeta variegata TaxID=151549 RepID=A0A4C1W1I9_EUMVA|nr:hypothetical protein EVAR_84422_1 [Eumeta japonica]
MSKRTSWHETCQFNLFARLLTTIENPLNLVLVATRLNIEDARALLREPTSSENLLKVRKGRDAPSARVRVYFNAGLRPYGSGTPQSPSKSYKKQSLTADDSKQLMSSTRVLICSTVFGRKSFSGRRQLSELHRRTATRGPRR